MIVVRKDRRYELETS